MPGHSRPLRPAPPSPTMSWAACQQPETMAGADGPGTGTRQGVPRDALGFLLVPWGRWGDPAPDGGGRPLGTAGIQGPEGGRVLVLKPCPFSLAADRLLSAMPPGLGTWREARPRWEDGFSFLPKAQAPLGVKDRVGLRRLCCVARMVTMPLQIHPASPLWCGFWHAGWSQL